MMIKTLIIIISLLFVSVTGSGQTKDAIDNLHQQLANAKDEIARIDALVNLCLLHRLGSTDSSLLYGQQALRSAQKVNYPEGEILALSFMSITVGQLGDLPRGLEMAFKALQIGKANHLEHLTGGALNAIGEIYITLKDYPKALHYLEIERSNAEANNDQEGLAYAKYDMGVAFYEMGLLDSAVYYEQQAIAHFQTYNREEPLVYRTLGDVSMKSGKLEDALNHYQKSLQIALKNNERRASAYAFYKLAEFYKRVEQPDSAIFYAIKSLDESRVISQKKTILDAALLMSELYDQRDTKESLRYLKIAAAYKDSLFGAGNIQAIQVLVNQQEEHQKEIEASRIRYQNNLKQYAFIAGFGILLLVAAILYRNNRQKQKANKVLEATLSNLRSTQAQLIQSEKMASLGELTAGIAHEIQNPLNFVNNFSEVNKELLLEINDELSKGNINEAKNITKDVFENEEKIIHHGKRADAIVKGMLQHSRSSTRQKEPTDINALCEEYFRLAYHGLKAKDKSFNATMKTDFNDTIGKINIIPQDIGRVILNLINNAFYAVDEKKKKTGDSYEPIVTVSTKTVKPPLGSLGVEIKVRDNGNGIPGSIKDKIFQPFFTTKPTGQGTGLGLSLAYDIVKAHGGEIALKTREGEYTEFILRLPYDN